MIGSVSGGIFHRVRCDEGWSLRDTFNERSICKLIFYIFISLTTLYLVITIFMPYYPNSSFSEPLTKFARTDSAFSKQWQTLRIHGAISCKFDGGAASVCGQNGEIIKNPMTSKLNSDEALGFDLYVVPDMFNGKPSVYVDKHRVNLPVAVVDTIILEVVTNLNSVRNLAKKF